MTNNKSGIHPDEQPIEVVHIAEVVSESPRNPVTPSPLSIELRSTGDVPASGKAQLYYKVPDVTKLIGFEVEEETHVASVMVGDKILVVKERDEWPGVFATGFDLRDGQYVTIMTENRSASSRSIRAVLLFVGGAHSKPASQQASKSAEEVSSQLEAGLPEPGGSARLAPSPDANVVIVVSKLQADYIQRLATFGRRPPVDEVPKICGRINAAILNAGKEPGPSGALVRIRTTAAVAQALYDAVRRNAAMTEDHRAALASGVETLASRRSEAT